MNGIRNNVVFCGFNEIDRRSFYLCDVRDVEWESGEYYDEITAIFKHRFPYVVHVDTIKEALKHQGYAIFLKVDSNVIKKTKREIDMYYRSLFHKYDRIFLYNEKFSCKNLNKFSNITFIGSEYLFGDLDDYINSDYYFFLKNNTMYKKNTPKVLNNVSRIKMYMKKQKHATSEKISKDLTMNVRSIQRYMRILNVLENCIGCDYYKNEWYYISPKMSV